MITETLCIQCILFFGGVFLCESFQTCGSCYKEFAENKVTNTDEENSCVHLVHMVHIRPPQLPLTFQQLFLHGVKACIMA